MTTGTTAKTTPPSLRRLAAALLGFILLGSAFTVWAIRREDHLQREALLRHAFLVAQSISPNLVQTLEGNLSDTSRPAYRRLKDQLMTAVQIDPAWEWIYLMGRTPEGKVFFQVDSEAYDAPDPSPPGQIYGEASDLLQSIFVRRLAATEGPLPDRWGTWVSAFVPLEDPRTGELVTVLGIDVDAGRWRATILRAGLWPALFTLAMVGILLAGHLLHRVSAGGTSPRRWRKKEAGLSLATGLVLTSAGVWLASSVESLHLTEAFTSLASMRTAHILDAFRNLQESGIEGLSGFIEGSENVNREEFHRYSSYLEKTPEVRAWGWVPHVTGAHRESFEHTARRQDSPDYHIWELNDQGLRIPSPPRDSHLPVLFLEPARAMLNISPGFDCRSMTAVDATLEDAAASRLATASSITPFFAEGSSSPSSLFLIARATYDPAEASRLLGYVVAVADPSLLLKAAMRAHLDGNPFINLDLLQLRSGQPPEIIASIHTGTPARRLLHLGNLSRPILAFGNTYAVAAQPTTEFFAAHSNHLNWIVLLAGLAVTLAATIVIHDIAHRRGDMEQLVEARTLDLATSIQRYNQLARHNRTITWEVDAAGLYTAVSDMSETIFGYRPDEMIGKLHFYDLTPEPDRAAFMRMGMEILRGGEPILDIVNAVLTKSGEIVWVSSSGMPIRDEHGHVTGYWGTDTDITARKQAEDALRESRRQLVEAQAMAHIGSWTLDLPTRRLEWSEEIYRMFGLDARTFPATYEAFIEAIHPDDRDAVNRAYTESLRTRHPYAIVHRLLLKDGTLKYVQEQCETVFDDAGNPLRSMGTVQDITAAKRVEEALRESERKYRTLTETMKDVVWIVDVETLKFVYISPSVEQLRGFTPAEVLAGTMPDSLAPDQREPLLARMREHAAKFRDGDIRTDTYFTHEITQPCKGGGQIIAEVVLHYVQNPETGRIEMHGVTRDITARKRAEQDYRTLFHEMLDGFAVHEILCDPQGQPVDYRFLAVNPAFERMTGLKAPDILGKTILEVLPQTEPAWIETYGQVALTGTPTFFQQYSAALDKHFEVTAFRPAPRQFACIFNDVTERVKAETELRESRRQYASLMANLPGMAYRCQNDRNWTMNFVSEGCRELTGYAPNELVANQTLSFNDLICPHHRERVWQKWQDVLQTRGRFEDEYEITTRDGRVKWVWEQGEGVYADDGRILALEGFISDIDERKRAALERERLMAAIEQSGETVVITDAAGSILYVNAAFEKITGYTREEAVGQNPKILSSGQHDREFYRQMWDTLMAGHPWEGQIVNRRKDGSLYTEMAAISPVRDTTGRIVHFVAVKRDITQQLHNLEEKEHLQAQLLQAQKMESIGRLAGGIAHDFNNMLQSILGYAEMALDQVPPDQPLHSDLVEIQKAAQRSSALTRQLQAFARKQNSAPRLVDLNSAIDGMTAMLRPLIPEGIALEWKPGQNLGLVKIDPSQLDRLVTNLCINARDAIGPSGQILIKTRNTTVERLIHNLHGDIEPGQYVVLSVRDNGCGMAPDVIQHIFEPFFTTKGSGKGTGLGLATVYGIVQQSGGILQVDSHPGKGSTFRIFFPHQTGVSGNTPSPDDNPSFAARGTETILIVEDEETLLQTASRMLTSMGYTILATLSPEKALQIVDERNGAIDLVLSDVIMPGLSGPAMVQTMLERHPGIKCLFMSGYTANLIAQEGIRTDSVNYLPKPFSRNTLAQKVREVLDRKS